MDIVKIRYKNSAGEYAGREYSYFSDVDLEVGAEIMVPVRNGTGAAQVTQTGVPEDEVAAFADRMKTITEIIPIPEEKPADPLAE